jgi:membrane-associated phospholipid phosphatase
MSASAKKRRARWFLLAYGAACASLIVLALFAHAHSYFAWDLRWELAWQAVTTSGVSPIMRALTWIGDGWHHAVVVALTVSVVVVWGARRDAAGFIASVLGGEFFAFIIKLMVHRPRPAVVGIYIMRPRYTLGFPSGHVVRFVVFYGFLFALAYLNLRRGIVRNMILIGLGLMLIGIGLSRVYVGEHWPSDVLGGYLIGLCWLGPVLMVYQRLRVPRRSILTGYPPLP